MMGDTQQRAFGQDRSASIPLSVPCGLSGSPLCEQGQGAREAGEGKGHNPCCPPTAPSGDKRGGERRGRSAFVYSVQAQCPTPSPPPEVAELGNKINKGQRGVSVNRAGPAWGRRGTLETLAQPQLSTLGPPSTPTEVPTGMGPGPPATAHPTSLLPSRLPGSGPETELSWLGRWGGGWRASVQARGRSPEALPGRGPGSLC